MNIELYGSSILHVSEVTYMFLQLLEKKNTLLIKGYLKQGIINIK